MSIYVEGMGERVMFLVVYMYVCWRGKGRLSDSLSVGGGYLVLVSCIFLGFRSMPGIC